MRSSTHESDTRHFNTGTRHTLAEAFDAYRLIELPAQNRAATTRRGYAYDLAELLRHLAAAGVTFVDQLDLAQLRRYLAHLDSRGLAGSTRQRKVAAMKAWLVYLERQQLLLPDFGAGLTWPKVERKEPRPLTKAQYEALMRVAGPHPRDQAILELLLQTGMRLSELVGLTVDDVTLPARISREGLPGMVRIRRKGGKVQELAVSYKAGRPLAAYLKGRPDGACRQLFLTKYQAPLTTRSVQKLFKKYAVEAGVPWAHPHSLRTTMITHMLHRGAYIKTVQDYVGHTSLATTSKYVGALKEDEIKMVQELAL